MGWAGAAPAHLAPPALPAPFWDGGRICTSGFPFTAAPRVFPFPLPYDCSHLLCAWPCTHSASKGRKLSLLSQGVPLAHPVPARCSPILPPLPQLVTAAAALRSVSTTGSCSGAAGTGDTASTAATTRPGRTARAAGKTITAGTLREPASPATATPQVRAAVPSRAPAAKLPSQLEFAGRDGFGGFSPARGFPIFPVLCLSPGVEPRGPHRFPEAPVRQLGDVRLQSQRDGLEVRALQGRLPQPQRRGLQVRRSPALGRSSGMGPGITSCLHLTPSRPCSCDPAGSVGTCDPNTGHCTCKERVEGHLCNR